MDNLPKKKTIPLEISNNTLFETVVGGFSLFSFIVVWLASLSSPLLFGAACYFNCTTTASVIALLTLCAYLPWKKGPISHAVRSFVDYYPYFYARCSAVFKGSLPGEKKEGTSPMFYAVHPHGAFCLGWSILFSASFMSSVRFCFSPALYFSPFFRLWCRMLGNPGKADKSSMIKYMKKGEHLALPPGGFEEATITSTACDRAYIKKRVGFIKLCLIHGYSVVPVYCFGENLTYNNAQGNWKARLGLNSFGIPAILIWGASFFPLFPKRHKHGMYIVAGEPIVLPKIENPSREDVKKWHDKYMAALLKTFDEHKCAAYGDEGKAKKLELW